MSSENHVSPVWHALPGPQTDAFESRADILFYGGAAGGGKTDLIIGAAFTRHRRSIIFRREYTQLKGIIDRTLDLFSNPEFASFNRSNLIWTIEDGRTVEFGAVQHYGDERRYQGRAHDLKAFDEITHFSEVQFRTLCGWLRTTDASQRCRVIATGNPPTDAEGDWVIRFFAPWLDKTHAHPAEPGELRWFTTVDGKDKEVEGGEPFEHNGEMLQPKSRTFIPARVEDNPYYMASGYKATLQAMPEPLRAQLLYGDFNAAREDNPYQLIRTEWVEQAMARHETRPRPPGRISCIGVDVARGGSDHTVITVRVGNWFAPQKSYPGKMTPDGDTVAQLVMALRGTDDCPVHVDVIGVGASAYDALCRHIGSRRVAGFNASHGSKARDRTGQLEFCNKRAEWWWALRESLDPQYGRDMALPRDRELFADLVAPRYKFGAGGVIQIESKDDIMKRIGRSPDKGDSLVYAHAVETVTGGGFLEFYARQSELAGN